MVYVDPAPAVPFSYEAPSGACQPKLGTCQVQPVDRCTD